MPFADRKWNPRISRRSRDRALRIAAAVLIAAALTEVTATTAAQAVATWAPGNPAIVSTYNVASLAYGGALLDVNGDGYGDFLLVAVGGTFYLRPLVVGGNDNMVFAQSPPVVAQPGVRQAKPEGTVACFPARPFAAADDIIGAGGPLDEAPCQTAVLGFSSSAYLGVIFYVPVAVGQQPNGISATNQDYGYLQVQVSGQNLTILSDGVQPYNVSTAAKTATWGRLKSTYR